MQGSAELLVIGTPALCAAVARSLPHCTCVSSENALDGLWTAGRRHFDAILLTLDPGPRLESIVRNLRTAAPGARIVAVAQPAEEPSVQRALAAGASDYVLEPVKREELEAALEIVTVPRRVSPPAASPTFEEVVQLSEVLKGLSDGPQATVGRLAALIQRALGATGVAIRVGEFGAATGDIDPAIVQEPIRRGDALVGEITLGRRAGGTYTASELARLGDYGCLVDVVIGQAVERERWQNLAWHDDLCGLANRRYFEETLNDLLGRAASARQRLTLVLFDIDDFKTYNDQYGHDTGDALLCEVATLLTRCSRGSDVVARYGGDEFAIILWDAERPRVPGSQHPSDPTMLAERFREAIHKHDFKCLGPDAPGPVTISGGLACYPWDGKTRREILKAADEALLAAKRSGKNRIVLASGGTPSSTGQLAG